MAIVVQDSVRLRQTATPAADGRWEPALNHIFNRELYPAIHSLRRFIFNTFTSIVSALNRYPPVFLTGATNPITTDHEAKYLLVSHATATELTIDAATCQALPLGAAVYMVQQGAGQLTLNPTGVTVRTAETLKTRKQWSSMMFVKVADTELILTGDLELF